MYLCRKTNPLLIRTSNASPFPPSLLPSLLLPCLFLARSHCWNIAGLYSHLPFPLCFLPEIQLSFFLAAALHSFYQLSLNLFLWLLFISETILHYSYFPHNFSLLSGSLLSQYKRAVFALWKTSHLNLNFSLPLLHSIVPPFYFKLIKYCIYCCSLDFPIYFCSICPLSSRVVLLPKSFVTF